MNRCLLQWLLGLVMGAAWLGAQAQTTVEYIHTDALGSVVAVTNAAGQVIERNDYEPYGAIIGKPSYGGVGFTGHVQDAVTGLTYMQGRYYDPQSGLFLSVDPVTADGNTGALFNRYMYAANNPYRYFDPDGRCTGSRLENDDGTCKSTGGDTTESFSASSSTVPAAPEVHAELNRSMVAPRNDGAIEKLTKNGNILDMGALAHDLFYPLMDSPEGAPIKAGGLLIVKIGRIGEESVRAAYNIGGRGIFVINGRLRISDGLNRGLGTLSEVKNVQSLSYTRQLRDYVDYARSQGLRFDLYVRPGASLSPPLDAAIKSGDITLHVIP